MTICRRAVGGSIAWLLLVATPGVGQDGYRFGACADPGGPSFQVGPVQSSYLTMRDRVRIAVDVILPTSPSITRFPTVLHITRYWRGGEGDPPNEAQAFFVAHGYATVWMDVRGTGASGGIWRRSRSKAETDDYAEVAAWIRQQPWSNGQIAGWGASYSANAADFLAAAAGHRIGAIVPLFGDFDLYSDLTHPGGVLHTSFGQTWSNRVQEQDRNRPLVGPNGTARGVRRVSSDSSGAELAANIRHRDTVPGVFDGYRRIVFKDDNPPGWDGSLRERSTHALIGPLERSSAPMFVWASWMDAGTANGAIHRFATLGNRQRVVIGAWSHGARHSASPFGPGDAPLEPSDDQQRREQLCFLNQYLRKASTRLSEREVLYYTMGEERWKTTPVWPPVGFERRRFFFDEASLLSTTAPQVAIGADRYQVDYQATTGTTNRWQTQLGGGDVIYPDRASADRRLLVYTTTPLERDVEVTGTPWINLAARSTHRDGAFFVYLEDVAPDGRVTYITEGQLRGLHRKTSSYAAPYRMFEPYHSFQRRDAAPIQPGKLMQLEFGLLPTSVVFRKGHRIRVAIAGADQGSFARIPETGEPIITIERSRDNVSWISLPMKDR